MKRRRFLKYASLAGIGAFSPHLVVRAENTVEQLVIDKLRNAPVGSFIQLVKTADSQYVIYGVGIETGCIEDAIIIPKKKGA